MSKRYYWLKMEKDYLTSPKIKKLRKIAGGDTYTIIYLKMQLLSIDSGGIIEYQGIEPTLHDELSLVLDEDPDNVKITISFLASLGLITEGGDGSFLLPEAATRIGSESDSADRVRKFRERKSLQCNALVTDGNASETSGNTDIDIDIDIDKEKDIDKEIEKDLDADKRKEDKNPKKKSSPQKKDDHDFTPEIEEVVSHLNNRAGTGYKPETNITRECISKILKAGYTVDDCKAVIDCKVQEWNGTEMQKYLRPSTLFADCHFEEYLQASRMKKPSSQNRQPNPKSSYDEYNDLNKFQRCEQEIERQIAAGERERAPWE